ncbi:MAG: N-6 DNA methylase [Flavobacteriales bacterium]|nr:N-6 DNA methylase [Flavobacteriales bacterium]
MGNERKTEDLVRRHFNKYSGILLEEQKSDNVSIQKLLRNASKKGDRHGLPEFIISFDDNAKFIIVVECKSDVRRHQSKSLDKYSDYAVDGVLLYCSFLSKEYDVLGIAVSGEKSSEIVVSHFLHLKGGFTAVEKFGGKLLDPESYLEGYINSPEKFNQDYGSLLTYSKTLSDKLHSIKIKASQRSLLISGVLIALTDRAFEASYQLHTTPEVLANTLAETVHNQLRKADLHSRKLENLRNAYNFIRTHAALSGEKGVLAGIVKDIDENINSFIKTYQYFDVLGQFYIEFLRYANSDKGLGIVLTPPHITQFFCDLAGVNKNSIVFDNCTGTGGFLISAMSKMVEDARGDKKKIKAIKENQLIGIEYQDDIFALACSNMFIHEDGKTNIINGDCFDTEVMNEVRTRKPTVGFLNPPYQANKKDDTEEFEFVLNNLQALERSGTCIAIVPMQCVLATSGGKFLLKKRLLQEHTLEAVLSMPDELFFNSDVNVITAVVVVTAHKPHPRNKETYFGYWKDDGFEKRKNKGRYDVHDTWEGIRQEWLESYLNRKSIPGLSVLRHITAEDEWCAEAYMETDYSSLSQEDFIRSIKSYVLINELYFKA